MAAHLPTTFRTALRSVRRALCSVRVLSLAAVSALTAIVLSLGLNSVAAAREAVRAAEVSAADQLTVENVADVELLLRERQRVGNVWLATDRSEVGSHRLELESMLRRSLSDLHAGAEAADDDKTSIVSLTRDIAAYLELRGQLEAEPLPLERVVQESRESLEQALASIEVLRTTYATRRERAQATTRRALERNAWITTTRSSLLAASLLLLFLTTRLTVLQPLLRLRGAMRRFRSGDEVLRVDGGPLLELRELADDFDALVVAVKDQRRHQLTFLAGIAHDLRNPLSTLKLSVQALQRDPAMITPDRLSRLDQQFDRLARMVGDLLDTTRIEAGELQLELTAIDLRDPVRTIVELYAPTLTEGRLSLVAPAVPVVVRGDALRLEQVAGNLINNAIKYSPEGGPVEVSVRIVEGEAELSVRDRGVGIPGEDLETIFAPFNRRPATAGAIPGVGLGLSIVRRIVSAHGGRIAVESTPGLGSVFRVRLPLASASPGASPDGSEAS